jgi:ABC-type glycerol-3-phosphate transport system permease component
MLLARRRWDVSIADVAIVATIAFMLLPILWALGASLKPAGSIFDLSPIPIPATLSNYTDAVASLSIARLLLNTLIMAAAVTLLDLIIAMPAAYALVIVPGRLRALVNVAIGVALLVPPEALVIPDFVALTHVGLRGTEPGLVLPQLWTCALAVTLLRDSVRRVPGSLIGAARLDGATSWEVLRHVVLPQCRPALMAVGTLLFINSWNEYLWPLIIAGGSGDTTIQPGLALFNDPVNPQYGPLMAASILASLPVVAVYLLTSRRIVGAFLHSGGQP